MYMFFVIYFITYPDRGLLNIYAFSEAVTSLTADGHSQLSKTNTGSLALSSEIPIYTIDQYWVKKSCLLLTNIN